MELKKIKENAMGQQMCVEETVSPFNKASISKVDRYGWSVKDAPGQFMLIPKRDLNVDHSYQRNVIANHKVQQIASDWSWVGCGCILAAMRSDESFWVFDGQHRVLAAWKRSDIDRLPCMVFQCASINEEAKGFLVANSERKPVSALDKFKALVMTGNPTARVVSDVLSRLDIEITTHAIKTRQLKCVSKCLSLAKRDAETFDLALGYTVALCDDSPIHKDILDGLFWIQRQHGLFGDRSFDEAIRKADRADVLDSIAKYAAAEGNRSQRVCGIAILKVLNHKRRNRFGEN